MRMIVALHVLAYGKSFDELDKYSYSYSEKEYF